MSDADARTGPARDVPPPRPVPIHPGPGAGAPEDGGGLGRAARAVADAVSGLLGSGTGTEGAGGRTAAAGVLRDVITAVAGAAGARRGPGPGGPDVGTAATGRGDDAAAAGGRGPAALLGDLLTAAAPRLPVRDAARLRAAHPGMTDEQIADALVARAGRVTAAIGAATGGLSAAQWFAPPSLLALPLELGAETVLTAAVEVVLVGELHELAGRRPAGDPAERAAAYLAAWSAQRAVDGAAPSFAAVLGSAGLRALRRRMGRRFARALPSAAPFLVGAAVAGRGNRRATEVLAERVRGDLRRLGPSLRPGG